MSEYFKGVTFANQHLSPADDAVIRRRLIADGVLTGCEISHSRDTLSMAPGYLMACGREILHPSAENWTVTYSPATSKTASGSVIDLSDASSGPLQGLRIYGRTTQDGTPTPDNPVELVSVGDSGSVGVAIAGAQIFNVGARRGSTINGITYTIDEVNGTISAKGTSTSTGNTYFRYNYTEIALSNGRMTFSGCPSGNSNVWVQIYNIKGTGDYVRDTGNGVTFDFKNENGEYNISLGVAPGATVDVVFKPMLNYGSVALPWEPYTAQTLPISTPNVLPGIPVTSGGNYTDADGQQWICDEVDFARGVYVQRVFYRAYNGSEGWNLSERNADKGQNGVFYLSTSSAILTGKKALNSRFKRSGWAATGSGVFDTLYGQIRCNAISTDMTVAEWKSLLAQWAADGAPMEFMAQLATPIETPIPEDELAAYAALHTNRPNTTVYNDAGAHMEVGYYPQDDAIPSNGYARTLLTVDLTRTAAADVFDQVNTSIEYADTEDGFPAPVQDDINSEGSVYQLPLAVVSIEDGAITGITDSIGNAEPI